MIVYEFKVTVINNMYDIKCTMNILIFQMQGKLDKLEEHLPKNVCRCCPFNIGIQELVPTLKKR